MQKALYWVGGTLGRLRGFPTDARRQAGHELYQVQLGLDPGDSKPMSAVGPGVVEIRVHASGEYRVLYVAKLVEGIYVLHAFEKRTRKTSKADIDLARRNLGEVLRARRR